MNQPVKCGGCRGNGVCSRCRGSGTTGKDEVCGSAIIVGPITCKRCGGNGVCPGSGWVAYCTVQNGDERR
jgi:hypothetical protein